MSDRRAGGAARSAVAEGLAALSREPGLVVGALVLACVMAFWVWRVQRGVDLSDEALYLAIPSRFAAGDRPFLDERSSVQGAGILLFPVVFLFRLVVGSTAGVVLFMRLIYLSFLAGLGLATARAVRGWITPGAALATGALASFFAPYWISQFSYNTMGGGLSLLAAVSALSVSRAATASEARRHAVACGLAAAGAVVAYPTLALLFPFHLGALVLFGRARVGLWRVCGAYVAGAAVVGIYIAVLVLRSGIGALRLTLDFIQAWGPTLGNSFDVVLSTVNQLKTDWLSSLAIAGAVTALSLRFRPAVLLLAIVVPVVASPPVAHDNAQSMRFFTCCAVFAPLFGALVEDKRTAFRVLAMLWAPSMLTGIVAGYSSTNKGLTCGVGGFGAMLAGCLLAARACEEAAGRWRIFAGALGFVPPLALLYVLGTYARAPEAMYREAPVHELTARVHVGPFKGLWTTPARRSMVEALHADVLEQTRGQRFALFLPDLPAAYLSTTARPAVPETWPTGTPGRSEIDARVLRTRFEQTGGVIVRTCGGVHNWMDCSPTLPAPTDPLEAAVLESYQLAFRRFDYSVWKKR